MPSAWRRPPRGSASCSARPASAAASRIGRPTTTAPSAGAAYLFRYGPADPVVIDFETGDDFLTPLINGQGLRGSPAFGRLVRVDARGPGHFGPAVFDSDPLGPNRADPDLLVDRGNLLILQEDGRSTVPGVFDVPDDAWFGGTLVFELTTPGEVLSLDLVDACPGPPAQDITLVLTDAAGATRTYSVPGGWTRDVQVDGPPGYGTLDLTTLAPQPGFVTTATATETPGFAPREVVRLEVTLAGSGAVDELVLRPGAAAATGAKAHRRR